ncbi:MAG: DUF420 domain-containing protein [Polyangiales bacterium]
MQSRADRLFFTATGIVSLVAIGFLFWLLEIHEATPGSIDLRFMPGVNAALNASSAVLLASAWAAIRRGRRDVHKRLVVGAFLASTLFLLGYVAYHAVHGDTRFAGEGPIRAVYLFILATHVILSMSVVPLALTCFYLAFRERFETHRKVARFAMPIWLYVSVTGVVIYFMLRGSAPAVP